MTTKLFEAIARHDLDCLAELLAQGSDPNAGPLEEPKLSSIASRPIIEAMDEVALNCGPAEAVMLLLRYGAVGDEALMVAVIDCNVQLARMLLSGKTDPNFEDAEGDTSLRLCVDHGNLELMAMLLRCGAKQSINSSGGPAGMSALGRAVFDLNLPMVQLLLKAGADPLALDVDREIAREHLPRRKKSDPALWDAVAALLPERPPGGLAERPSPVPVAKKQPTVELAVELRDAIEHHDLDKIADLLDSGADANRGPREPPIITAIGEIIDGAPIEMVVLLIRHGAASGEALLCALMDRQYEVARLLLAAGADTNFRNEEGDSPLRWCVAENELAMAATLLRCGAKKTINEGGGPSGMNALGMAVFRLNLPMVKLLLKAGADPLAPDLDGHMAREHLPRREESDPEVWDAVAALLPECSRTS